MTEKEIFAKKAASGYIVCFAEQCPKKEQCLHWKVGQQMPDTNSFCSCISPRYPDVATERCRFFRQSKKVSFAKGMTRIFTDDMPQRVEKYVRQKLVARYNRTYFFEYRNGKFLIPPAMQEEIRGLFREAGWNGEVAFDGFVEDYDW